MRLGFIWFAVLIATCLADAKEVLIIGDSHSCMAFGRRVVSDLTAKGNHATLYCAVSSSPAHWVTAKTPRHYQCEMLTSSDKTYRLCGGNGKIPDLNRVLTPLYGRPAYDEAVIALGTNSLYDAHSPLSSSYMYGELAKRIRNAIPSCKWVGPPHLRPDQTRPLSQKSFDQKSENNLSAFYVSLKRGVETECDLIDSRAITARGQSGGETVDGTHRGTTPARAWADEIVNSL